MTIISLILPRIEKRWLFSFFLVLPLFVSAQTFSTKQLLSAWSFTGLNQTINAELAYADLTENFDSKLFYQRVAELNEELKKDPNNKRLAARVMLYKMQGKPEQVSVKELWSCVLQITTLNDDQLLSEMYAKYAEIKAPQKEKLYYLLKALQIQERIGVKHFHHIYFRYLTVGGMLYRTDDFKRSLYYSLKGLKSFNKKKNYVLDNIFLLDLAGASYKNLGQLDSAFQQYIKLDSLLGDYKRAPQDYTAKKLQQFHANIWQGISDGGKGRVLVLQGRYNEAYPLLKSNLDSALKYNEFGNAVSVLNVLANVRYKQNNLGAALALYQKAHNYGLLANEYHHLKANLETAEGLAKTFSAFRRTDSAYVYLQKFNLLKDSVQSEVNAFHFSATNTALEFELMQKDFSIAQQELANQKLLRNAILVGIVFLCILAVLIYDAKRLKFKVEQEKLSEEKKLAQQEVIYAKEQLDTFMKRITEKNKLIEDLKSRYGNQTDSSELIPEDISILTDEDWNNFRNSFQQVHPHFFVGVKKLMPDITTAELRFLALSKLNMPTKEMAMAQGITQHAIRKQRHRLRKKLEIISPNFTLETFLEQV